MWSPTHIKVTINSARNLLCKGKNNTNNCFVTIALGKEKYQTSVKEKAESKVEWKEECELQIPDQGNRAELALTCLHRNNLGIDEFLGQVTLPLNEMDAYVRSKAKWYRLESKPGKEKKYKERGELEVEISFTVKSGSLTDLSKKDKHKSSIGQLASSVGGSLLSISTIEKRKGIKKIAKKFGSKLHLNGSSKKKNKEEDDMSYSGSFASIGTPNRVRVPDSDDDDDFQFDKLSQKSSASSLNIRDALQPSSHNFAPKNASPLIGSAGKGQIGKEHHFRYDGSDNLSVDPELEEIENEFSIRARTLPPPSKPPRTPQMDAGEIKANGKDKKNYELDDWETKLYGRSGETVNSDSLKRRSWEPVALPLKTTNFEVDMEKEVPLTEPENMNKSLLPTLPETQTPESFTDTSSSSDEEFEAEKPKLVVAPVRQQNTEEKSKKVINGPPKPTDLQFSAPKDNNKAIKKDSLTSPDVDKNEFAKFNASFAKFEQRNSSKFFNIGDETNNFLKNESLSTDVNQPQPKPRARVTPTMEKTENIKAIEEQDEKRKRAAEDARLEAELRENEKLLKKEEAALQQELRQRVEQEKRREAKRREEDFRILNFSKRLVSQEDKPEETKEHQIKEPQDNNKEQSKVEKKAEINNIKEFNFNREKQTVNKVSTPSPKQNERIIIGHEKTTTQAERRAEISAALARKYEGKSREELMLIANGMENEALIQRQRVKELEDYLDNLLLRVMETHPKILQNPYSRTTSAKSFKNYINMNDFL